MSVAGQLLRDASKCELCSFQMCHTVPSCRCREPKIQSLLPRSPTLCKPYRKRHIQPFALFCSHWNMKSLTKGWHLEVTGQQQYSSNSPVIWISNSRLLLLENGPVINLFSLLFVFITIHAVQVKSYNVPFSHIWISQYRKEWLHSDALVK